MFVVKKLISAFIMPPGIFIAFFIVAGAVLLVRRYRKIGLAAILTGMLMWGLTLNPVTDVMFQGLIRDLANENRFSGGDVIVLLGGGVDAGRLDLSGERGILSEPMAVRTVTAARLFRKLRVPIIVSGGDPFGHGVTEAGVARRYLVDMGVPAKSVILESGSRDTFENAQKVGALCTLHGFEKPILVTSAYHLKRALWCFEKEGITCRPFANGLTILDDRPDTWEKWLPGHFDGFSKYLHEYIGLLYYRLAY